MTKNGNFSWWFEMRIFHCLFPASNSIFTYYGNSYSQHSLVFINTMRICWYLNKEKDNFWLWTILFSIEGSFALNCFFTSIEQWKRFTCFTQSLLKCFVWLMNRFVHSLQFCMCRKQNEECVVRQLCAAYRSATTRSPNTHTISCFATFFSFRSRKNVNVLIQSYALHETNFQDTSLKWLLKKACQKYSREMISISIFNVCHIESSKPVGLCNRIEWCLIMNIHIFFQVRNMKQIKNIKEIFHLTVS